MVRMRVAFKCKKCLKLRGISKPEFQPVLPPTTHTTKTIPESEGLLLSRIEKYFVCLFGFCFVLLVLT